MIDLDKDESLAILFYVLLCFSMILGDAEYNMMLDGFVWFMLIMYVKILSVPNPDNYSQMGFSYWMLHTNEIMCHVIQTIACGGTSQFH